MVTLGIPLPILGVDDHQMVAKGYSHQTKGKRPESIGSQFSLSVCDITDIGND